MRDLIDPEDGENRAVRWFLACYGGACGVTIGAMKRHLKNCGYPFWPAWADEQDSEHLTKGGAQHWLRHLFALEPTRGVPVAPAARKATNAEVAEWAERHDLRGSATDLRCAFEDAQTLHMTAGVEACQTEQDCNGVPWCRINGKCQRAAGVTPTDAAPALPAWWSCTRSCSCGPGECDEREALLKQMRDAAGVKAWAECLGCMEPERCRQAGVCDYDTPAALGVALPDGGQKK